MSARHDPLVRLRPRPFERHVGQGRTVLSTGADGWIDGSADQGLFVHETRMLSLYRHRIDGAPPLPVALSNVAEHTWLGYYACAAPGTAESEPDTGSGQLQRISQETLELRISRFVGGGFHEDVDLTNFTRKPLAFTLELELDGDFADLEETRGERRQQGTLTRRWREVGELSLSYRAESAEVHQGRPRGARIERELRVRVTEASSPPRYEDGRVRFQVELAPAGTWHACLDFVPHVEHELLGPRYGCRSFAPTRNAHDFAREEFLARSTRFSAPVQETLTPVVLGALEQARRDLATLRLHDVDRQDGSWTTAAGFPLYVALFGRDALTSGWQAALLGPEMMRGSLAALVDLQGETRDDWRDEQPGRMLHEAHTGPLAKQGFHPRARYYGSVTTSGFYPFVLSELWHWTGDAESVRPLLAPALDALAWLDQECERIRGFYAYRTRSEQGVANQGWKDSGDAIVREDGARVDAPIATCEEQAFAYVAKLHLAEVLWCLGERETAKHLFRGARELKSRFNDAFPTDDGFLALGLDAEGRQIRSIGSNAGHCLAAGIVERDHAEKIAARLFSDDLFSGWGIRTLSSKHPAYNPYSYHRGSVWPVEHGSFALGFLRFGLHHALETLCRAQFEAASLFEHFRLPELFAGHARDEDHPFPALYPQANSPQAWSASAMFSFVQSLLGLYPYAPLKLLLIDPHLPPWLPELTVHRLRVGRAVVTLEFRRVAERTTWKILALEGTLHVLHQPSPWSLTADLGERLEDALASLAG